jgi:tripartite-type tricarboxylate transporter receptor subunit TctC
MPLRNARQTGTSAQPYKPFCFALTPASGGGSPLIGYAKANPGKVNMASSGVGASPHLSGELFKLMTGINMTHVPYRGLGAGGYSDLMSGTVHVAFDNIGGSLELIRSGKLRPLAVTSANRTELLPEVPTVSKFVQGTRRVWPEASERPETRPPK